MNITITIPDSLSGPLPTIELSREQLHHVLVIANGKQYVLGLQMKETIHGLSSSCPDVIAGHSVHCHGHRDEVLIARPLW